MPRLPIAAVIARLGLMTNCKLILDAGDDASYPASGTKWLDLSGGGYDFFRGTTNGADATDPTFNGTNGRNSGSEYWTSDGGDMFTYDTTNETWMQNLHKANVVSSGLAWIYKSAAGNFVFIGNTGGAGTLNTGFAWRIDASATPNVGIWINNASVGALVVTTQDVATGISLGTWSLHGYRLDIPNGTMSYFVNGVSVTTQSASLSSPAAGNSSFVTQVAGRGNSNSPMIANDRYASLVMWEGRAITIAEMCAYWMATRGKFGI